MKPTVLVITTSRWFAAARLAVAFSTAGCTVEALCPPGHPISKTRAVRQTHHYGSLAPLRSLARAITTARPDLIVPSDDLAMRHLHDLYRRQRYGVRSTAWVRELIERSLGAPESFPVVCARTAFAELAQDLGIRVPHTEIIANHSDLERWVARMGLPTVLKANGTSGGYGVRIVQTMDEAERAFRKLQAPPSLRQAFLSRDRTLIWPCLKREQPVMNAQRFVVGREVTSTIACWKGTVIGALHFEVVNKLYSTGPASVLRLIENPEMLTAAERVVCQLKLSGIHGFDFILEAQTGNLFLIEINARATQVGHLALGPGRDLPAALCAAVSGVAVQAAPRVTENDTIALFPQEWMRDPGSKFLQSSYHDVPWTEPGLLKIR